jgi:hypothetical protein
MADDHNLYYQKGIILVKKKFAGLRIGWLRMRGERREPWWLTVCQVYSVEGANAVI